MHKSRFTIGILQTIMIMMLFNGLISHVIINPMVLDASGRDAWISVLVTAVLFVPWSLILVYIMRKSAGEKLQPWLARRTTSWLSWLMLIPLMAQLYLIGGLTILHTSIWAVSNYLPATPQYVLIISLVIICHYAACHGIRTIAIGAGIMLPTVVVLGYFVSIANISEKDWLLLKPFLENGPKPVLNGMIFCGGAFVEMSILLLFQHRLRVKMKAWHMLVLASIIVYITLGPLVGAITEFGPKEAAKQMVSPYEQWRLVKLGNYIEHVDFLSVYQWLAGASIRIGLSQFLLADMFPFKKPKSRRWLITGISLSYIVLSILGSHMNTFYLGIYESYMQLSLVLTLILTSIWAVIAWRSKSAKEEPA